MAKKAELKESQERYDDCVTAARAAETACRYHKAIEHAVNAWEYVDEMMSYERRFEEKEFRSVPCIDIVLRLAPLIFDSASLEAMRVMLRAKRVVDRHASDDLAARLDAAVEVQDRAYRLWKLIEHEPDVRQDTLRARLGGDQDEWRRIAERWESMGFVIRTPEGGSYRLKLVTDLGRRISGKCSGCGLAANEARRWFLGPQDCPKCEQPKNFVMLAETLAQAV